MLPIYREEKSNWWSRSDTFRYYIFIKKKKCSFKIETLIVKDVGFTFFFLSKNEDFYRSSVFDYGRKIRLRLPKFKRTYTFITVGPMRHVKIVSLSKWKKYNYKNPRILRGASVSPPQSRWDRRFCTETHPLRRRQVVFNVATRYEKYHIRFVRVMLLLSVRFRQKKNRRTRHISV